MAERSRTPSRLLCLAGLATAPVRAGTAPDPASLDRLHDVVAPEPVPLWWPPAPGWYLLAGVAVAVAAWTLWRGLRRRRARRYRVEALGELRALRRRAADPLDGVADTMILLKRTALAAYPRARVANLSGEAWWAFLDRSVGTKRFSDGLGARAERLVYARQGGDEAPERVARRLYKAAGRWIAHHRPADASPVADAAPGTGPPRIEG